MSSSGKRRDRFHQSYADSYLLGPSPSAVTSAALRGGAGAARPLHSDDAPTLPPVAATPAPFEHRHPLDALLALRGAAVAHGERQEAERGPHAIVDALGLFRHFAAEGAPAQPTTTAPGPALADRSAAGPAPVAILPEADDITWNLLLDLDGGAASSPPRERPQLHLVANPPADPALENDGEWVHDEDTDAFEASASACEYEVDFDDDTMDPEAVGASLSALDGEENAAGAPQDFTAAVRWARAASLDAGELDAWLSEEAQ